jgi:hypothetical protein
MSYVRASFALAVMVVMVGCAPGRVADLQDSLSLGIGIGAGLGIDAKAGMFTHPALGSATASAMLGSDSRDVSGAYYQVSMADPHASFWAHRLKNGNWGAALNESGWRAAFEVHEYTVAVAAIGHPPGQERPTVVLAEFEGEELSGTLEESTWLPDPDQANLAGAMDFQVGATALILSVRAGVNPLELIDFLLGFAGLDIAGDDQ